MAQEEKYGERDLTYSAWHRRQSTSRFVAADQARVLAMIDLDHCLWIECDDGTKEPMALIEEAQDVDQDNKPSTITRKLAMRASLPAFVVLWKPSDDPNPADPDWPDIESFRVKRIWPLTESEWRTLTPKQWAEALCHVRTWSGEQIDRWLFRDN